MITITGKKADVELAKQKIEDIQKELVSCNKLFPLICRSGLGLSRLLLRNAGLLHLEKVMNFVLRTGKLLCSKERRNLYFYEWGVFCPLTDTQMMEDFVLLIFFFSFGFDIY